ncbi:MAG TPA: hypothetical protein VFF06_02415 [Polyangia bacterium]|nr:hypothetical protein [Polyangia bacterium]
MKKILFILLLILAAYLFWRWWTSDASALDGRGQDLVYDRLWVDHVPKSDTDTFQIFAAVTEQPIGIFQAGSSWKGSWELFRYDNKGDGKIVFVYPQTRESERGSYRATKCSEKGFDYCLELAGNSRGARRYFSQKGWELRGTHGFDELKARVSELETFAPAPQPQE